MRMRLTAKIAAGWLIAVVSAAAAAAELKLPAVIGDNMVLQRGRAVPIWGWTEPGQTVTVSAGGTTLTAKAGQDGRWQVVLPAMQLGGPMEIVVKDSSASHTIKNVLVGEVWVASGQSNMAWPVRRSENPDEEIAAAHWPKVRLFGVGRVVAETPQADCTGRWNECRPETVADFSAVAYYFGRELNKQLGVPIGLIASAVGATPAEAWTRREALEAEPLLKPLLEQWDKMVAEWPKLDAQFTKRYAHKLKNWEATVAKAQPQKKPSRPPPPDRSAKSTHRPANLYNAMIAPLTRYPIRGVIWYQGESNATRAWQYRTLLPVLIRDWRSAWAQGDFPFGQVQLAPFRYELDVNFTDAHPAWCAELREAQALVQKTLPNIGMAVTMDIGDLTNIHPKNKQEVGRRLALWALATVYGRDIVYCGPIYEAMAVEGNNIRIRFTHTGTGLTTRDGKPPNEFTIAGANQKFHPANAAIDGDTVIVSSPGVPSPVAVRFAWRDAAVPNLANKEGLPAAPFRTDQWRLLTERCVLNEEPY